MNAKYIQMSIEELVEDEVFIRTFQKPILNQEWLQWQSKQSAEVQERISAAGLLVASLSSEVAPFVLEEKTIQQLWSRIDRSTMPRQKVRTSRLLQIWPYLVAAAAIVLLAIFLYPGMALQEVINPTGAALVVTLPSSSEVTLAADAKITYNPRSWKEKRVVNLEGKAYFDITKGGPFSVVTSQGQVQVLGTAFHVMQYESSFIVAVDRGVVLVDSDIAQRQLRAGMSYMKNPRAKDIDQYAGRASTYVVLQQSTIKSAKAALSAMYDISFSGLESEEDRLFNGSFDSEDLHQALHDVFWTAGMKYDLMGDDVILSN